MCVQEIGLAEESGAREHTPSSSARSIQGHVARTLQRMRVSFAAEQPLLRGLLHVDFTFAAARSGPGALAALEVDGPSHFLLELPANAGAALSRDELGAASTIRGAVSAEAIDAARRIADAFEHVNWGARHRTSCRVARERNGGAEWWAATCVD
jgi:hypothetical protein